MASTPMRTIGLLLAVLAGCGAKPPDPATSASSAVSAPAAAMEIVELRPGSGAAVVAGNKAVVQYTGWFYETSAADKKGREFDSSRSSGQPFKFTVGAAEVIKGWDQGVLGMQVGGLRRLTIPADLAYGDVGSGNVIPPGATLVFDVELVAIE